MRFVSPSSRALDRVKRELLYSRVIVCQRGLETKYDMIMTHTSKIGELTDELITVITGHSSKVILPR